MQQQQQQQQARAPPLTAPLTKSSATPRLRRDKSKTKAPPSRSFMMPSAVMMAKAKAKKPSE
jgi:hypothetical protein